MLDGNENLIDTTTVKFALMYVRGDAVSEVN